MLLFFQTALLDSASVAGLRMMVRALATPLGGLATGIAMMRGTDLALVTQIGLMILLIVSIMTMTLTMDEPEGSIQPILYLATLDRAWCIRPYSSDSSDLQLQMVRF